MVFYILSGTLGNFKQLNRRHDFQAALSISSDSLLTGDKKNIAMISNEPREVGSTPVVFVDAT